MAQLSLAAMGCGGAKPSVVVFAPLAWWCLCHHCGAAGHTQGPGGCRCPSAESREGDRGSMSPPCSPPRCPLEGTRPQGCPVTLTFRCVASVLGAAPGCWLAAGRRSAAQGGNQTASSDAASSLFPAAGQTDSARPAASKETFHSKTIFCCSRQALGKHSWHGSIPACAHSPAPAPAWAGGSASEEEHSAAAALRRGQCAPRCPCTPGQAARRGTARRGTARQGVGLAQAALLGVETQSGTPSLTGKGGAGPLTPPGTARGSRDTCTRSHAQPHQGCLL